jgi:MFS family permease
MNRRLSPAWMLAILTGLNLFNYLDRFVLSAVLPPLKAELHLNDGQAGSIATAFMIGYFLTSPVFGYLGDRFSRKWLIAVGIFIWSVGTVLTGFAQGFVMLLCFRVLVGTGEASYATVSPSLISDSYHGERRNMALTIFYVAIPVGAALGNILGGAIGAHYSWRHAFIWAGAPGLLLALVLLPFEEPTRGGAESTTDAHKAKPTPADVLKLFRIPDFMLVTIGYTAYTFGMGAFGTWGPSFFVRVHHMTLENADSFFGVMLVVTGLLGTFVGGWLASLWHRKNPAGYALTLGLSVLLAVPLAVLAFTLPDPHAAQACLAGAMFLLWFSTGPVNTVILDAVPVNLHASAMAVSIFMIHLFGDMWSSEIVGHLSDHWQSLQRAVLILPGALFIAALLWLWLAVKTFRRPATGGLVAAGH